MKNKPIARKSDLVIQESGDELLIYDLKTNKAYCLNETSAIVWQLCDGKNSISEMATKMSKQLKNEISEDFVHLALTQLIDDDLLESNENLNQQFKGISRRKIIKKVGFASVVALPIVSGIVAPKATFAQSGGLPFQSPCTNDSQCLSGTCRNGSFCCGSPGETFDVDSFCDLNGRTLCCSGNPGIFVGPSPGPRRFTCQCV